MKDNTNWDRRVLGNFRYCWHGFGLLMLRNGKSGLCRIQAQPVGRITAVSIFGRACISNSVAVNRGKNTFTKNFPRNGNFAARTKSLSGVIWLKSPIGKFSLESSYHYLETSIFFESKCFTFWLWLLREDLWDGIPLTLLFHWHRTRKIVLIKN